MTHRVFTALSFHHFESEITTYRSKIDARISGVKWVLPNAYHLTFHFFAAMENEELLRLSQTYREIAQKHFPLKLGLSGLGAFPEFKNPRILWLGVYGDLEKMQKLHQDLSQALMEGNFRIEKRPFYPHVTLARSKRGGVHVPRNLPEIKTHEIKVQEITLYESFLSEESPRYEIVEKFSFSSL